MTVAIIQALLVAAGAALVAQNILMAKITGATSTVLVALLMNSAVGLALLSALILFKTGISGLGEFVGVFRLWFVIPGVLGTFFVYAGITGYQTVGAGSTIAILVTSQLVCGLAWDILRSDNVTVHEIMVAALGAGLLVFGVFVIVSRNA